MFAWSSSSPRSSSSSLLPAPLALPVQWAANYLPMILTVAVLLGLSAGIIRAWIGKRGYRVEELKAPGLVILAFLPQLLVFILPITRERFSDPLASIFFSISLVFLLAFSLINIRKSGFWMIGVGFLANVLAIILNGGWMPISPEMTSTLFPNAAPGSWEIGKRLGFSKDIVLSSQSTKLAILADRFTLPDWIQYKVAFSIGDVLIFIGVVWLLWALGGKQKKIIQGDRE